MENSTEVKTIKFSEVVKKYNIPYLNCAKNINYSPEAVEKAKKNKHAIPTKYINLRNNLSYDDIKDAIDGKNIPNMNGNGYFLNNPNHDLIQCYFKYCENLYIIDDDETHNIFEIMENIPILKKLPYTLSCGKKRPHYFFICENMPDCLRNKTTGLTKIFQFYENIDILRFLVEDPNGDFTYYDDSILIPKIDFEELKPYLKQEIFKEKKHKDENLDSSYIAQQNEYIDINTCSNIDLLNIPGYDSNQEWFKMRILIKSAFSENGRHMFINWSKKSNKFCEQACNREFDRNDYLREPKAALNILKYLASQNTCNYFEYNEKEFAELFYKNNKHMYVISNKHLYELNEYSVWCDYGEKDFSNRKLKIHACIEPYIIKYTESLLNNINLDKTFAINILDNTERQSMLKVLELKQDHIKKESKKVLKHVGSMGYLLSVSKAVTELFIDHHFYKKLDKNPLLFPFNNVLFDCSICEIREIKYNDYISLTCGYNYSKDYSKETYEEVQNFLKDIVNLDRKIVENEDAELKNIDYTSIHEVLIDLFSSCLNGSNQQNIMSIFIGRGGNGKSLLMNLIKNCFGNFYGVLSGLHFQKDKSDSNAHDAELHALKNSRITCTSEMNVDLKIKPASIEYLTGNETIKTRTLNEKPEEWVPFFKPILLINDLPSLDFKEAILRRLLIIRFPYLFRTEDEFDETNPYHKKADITLSSKFQKTEYRDALINIFIENYILKFKHGPKIIIPEYCKRQKEELKILNSQNTSNDVEQFIEQNFKFNPDKKYQISTKILYDLFKDYCQIQDIEPNKYNICSFSKKLHILSKFEKKVTKYYTCLINIEHIDPSIQQKIQIQLEQIKKKNKD